MTNKNLILTRKEGNKIIIHDNKEILCTLTVVSVGSSQCKLGFQADAHIKIDREEIFNTKLLEED
jgi:carbon storage regulator CsrA|tara:strand:+ start:290 stop:484 length:195 start_codon:yes stop_codon:yes gene_type:complete